ncbi:permease [Chitinilyticum piscinae]|uniref:Permease n=1 Tax=Chitinilyticum piscinae TaxID=2866724 RepID=A0A8J7FJL2_9NEIS|nr:permease [Chitinilyticum piscinae]MBE9610383.1 permease [Chitinilyticum piscinae]
MSALLGAFTPLLHGGLANLAAYLAAHVLLCLLPAFFIAGAMAALIPQSVVTRFLGRESPGGLAYPAAAAAGSLLAVCSCTIVPLFAGIYRKGAGLGPAVTFLFFAPAANILALVYTGGVIGADLALARLLLALVFGIGIGLSMALLFPDAEQAVCSDAFARRGDERMARSGLQFLLLWVALLLAGTLKLAVLSTSVLTVKLPWAGAAQWQAVLDVWVVHDAARGEEGISVHGALLVLLLLVLGGLAWRGFERIHAGMNAWARAALLLLALTIVLASLNVQAVPEGLQLGVPLRMLLLAGLLLALWLTARRLGAEALQDWLWESWRFARQIMPLLVLGVLVLGMIRPLIRPEWIQTLAGSNTLSGNLAGVLFGVFMYFPTLVEVPIAHLFLQLGMHRGPLLAYLMADPELSLQSMLVIAAIIGKVRTAVYVLLVALFSVVAGWTYGAWIDGASVAWLALLIALFISGLSVLLRLGARWRAGHD